MEFHINDEVVLLPPFDLHFPGVHFVSGTGEAGDGEPVVYLGDIESAFSPVFLQGAE